MIVVTPPAAAAIVPDSKSSAVVPPNISASRCVCGSTAPGSRIIPRASMVSVAGSNLLPGSVTPEILPSLMPTSASLVASGVTTVAPVMARSSIEEMASAMRANFPGTHRPDTTPAPRLNDRFRDRAGPVLAFRKRERRQAEAGNLGPAVDADPHPEGAEAAIGIDVEIFVEIQARVELLADSKDR